MFEFIQRKLSRQVAVWLICILLPLVSGAAFAIIEGATSRAEEEAINRGVIAARAGAQAYSAILEAGVDSGKIDLAGMIDLPLSAYVQIQGLKTDVPRYHNPIDGYTDMYVQAMEDEIRNSNPDIIYSTGIDTNGYVPTTHLPFSELPTGDKKRDKEVARSKMRYNTALHLSAARSPLPLLIQPYHRDTGDEVWDIAVPIKVKGQHFGAFRVGITKDSINRHRQEAIRELVIIFSVLVVFAVLFIFLIVRASLKPLEQIVIRAYEMSIGDGLDIPLISDQKNEIGQVAKSFNRMRISLEDAMERLDWIPKKTPKK